MHEQLVARVPAHDNARAEIGPSGGRAALNGVDPVDIDPTCIETDPVRKIVPIAVVAACRVQDGIVDIGVVRRVIDPEVGEVRAYPLVKPDDSGIECRDEGVIALTGEGALHDPDRQWQTYFAAKGKKEAILAARPRHGAPARCSVLTETNGLVAVWGSGSPQRTNVNRDGAGNGAPPASVVDDRAVAALGSVDHQAAVESYIPNFNRVGRVGRGTAVCLAIV